MSQIPTAMISFHKFPVLKLPRITTLDSSCSAELYLGARQHSFIEPTIPRTFVCIILQCEHCQPVLGNLVNCGAT